MLAYVYPILGVFWTLTIFFLWAAWIFVVVWVLIDEFSPGRPSRVGQGAVDARHHLPASCRGGPLHGPEVGTGEYRRLAAQRILASFGRVVPNRSGAMGTTTSSAVSSMPGYKTLMITTARTSPTSSNPMNPGADDGLIPAKVLDSIRPTTMAGLAKLVEDVQK